MGRITIEFDPVLKQVISRESEIIPVLDGTLNLTPVSEVENIVKKYQAELGAAFTEVLGTATEELPVGAYADDFAIGNWWTDAIREAADVQFAFINSSGIFLTIPQGSITLGKIYDVSPFDNNIVKTQMTGAQIKDLFEITYDSMRFQGQGQGTLQISGLTVKYDSSKPNYEKIVSITLSDETPLNDTEKYSVATIDFLAGGGNGYDNLAAMSWDETGIPAP